MNKEKIKYLWRTKFPWILAFYILATGVFRALLQNKDLTFALNVMMIFVFSSYVFIFIFYVYGVRPDELEEWHKK